MSRTRSITVVATVLMAVLLPATAGPARQLPWSSSTTTTSTTSCFPTLTTRPGRSAAAAWSTCRCTARWTATSR